MLTSEGLAGSVEHDVHAVAAGESPAVPPRMLYRRFPGVPLSGKCQWNGEISRSTDGGPHEPGL